MTKKHEVRKSSRYRTNRLMAEVYSAQLQRKVILVHLQQTFQGLLEGFALFKAKEDFYPFVKIAANCLGIHLTFIQVVAGTVSLTHHAHII